MVEVSGADTLDDDGVGLAEAFLDEGGGMAIKRRARHAVEDVFNLIVRV